MRFPNENERTLIVGMTGSGKTVAGLWILSEADWDKRVWIILDFKGDDWLARIPADVMNLGDPLPTEPGLYIYRPVPENDDGEVEKLMWEMHARGNIGLYIDEGYMISRRNRAFRALLTQGRSKGIPIITLTQRPKNLPNGFIISESNFYLIFYLSDFKDIERVQEFIPQDVTQELAEYHAYMYKVSGKELVVVKPPPPEALLDRMYARLPVEDEDEYEDPEDVEVPKVIIL